MDLNKQDIAQYISKNIEDCAIQYSQCLFSESKPSYSWTNDFETVEDLQELLKNSSITNKQIDMLFRSILCSYTHRLMVMLDNGSELADKGNLFLINESKYDVGENLKAIVAEELDKIEFIP